MDYDVIDIKSVVNSVRALALTELFSFGVNIPVIFDDTESICRGICYFHVDDNGVRIIDNITVGTSGLNKWSHNNLFIFIKSLFHEVRHCMQEKPAYFSDAMNVLMEQASHMWYNDETAYRKHYYDNIKEADAEYYGFKRAFEIMVDIFGYDLTSNVVLTFIKKRSNKPYFINLDKKFDTVESIFEEFEKMMVSKL